MSTKRAPAGLGARGKALWKAVLEVYDLTAAEQEVLAEACRLVDEIDRLRAAVGDGLIVSGSVGQPRVHPGVGEMRQHRLALARLLAQLDLPDTDGSTVLSPASLRGRKAAQSRWAHHQARTGRTPRRGAASA